MVGLSPPPARRLRHLDWSLVPDEPVRFENLVACHLLKWVHHRQDTQGLDVELRYFRDTDGREVDFLVVDRGRPTLCVECKWSDAPVDKSLRYFKARFPDCDAWQISAVGTKDYVVSARKPSLAASGGDLLLNLTANPWGDFASFQT